MHKTLPQQAMRIPEHARLAFHGKLYDVYQWPQAMFDGTTKTFEMLKRADTVQVIVVREDSLLLVHDEQPGRPIQIHFPGGRADDHDTSWLTAAQRELREEAGLVCKTWRLVSVSQPIIKIEWFTPIFIATDIEEELPQKLDADGERITTEWVPFDEVRKAVLSGETPMMQYLVPFFSRVNSIKELLNCRQFEGLEVDI